MHTDYNSNINQCLLPLLFFYFCPFLIINLSIKGDLANIFFNETFSHLWCSVITNLKTCLKQAPYQVVGFRFMKIPQGFRFIWLLIHTGHAGVFESHNSIFAILKLPKIIQNPVKADKASSPKIPFELPNVYSQGYTSASDLHHFDKLSSR